MTAPVAPPAPAPPSGRRWIRVVLTVVVLALVAMWVYAFVFAPRSGVNPVRDDAWREGAEAACERADEALAPLVFTTRITGDSRDTELPKFVANLDAAIAVFGTMLDEIDAVPRTSERAQVLVPQWLSDYRLFVGDVQAWTDALRAGRTPEFSVTRADTGIPIDERINTFATENRIKACRIDQLARA